MTIYYPTMTGVATAKSLEGIVIAMGFTIGVLQYFLQWTGFTNQELCKRGRSERIWHTKVPSGFQGQSPGREYGGRFPRSQRQIKEFAKGGRSLPFPSFPFFSPFLFSLPPSPLEVGPLKPARGSGERCKLPSGVWGGAPAENEFGAL